MYKVSDFIWTTRKGDKGNEIKTSDPVTEKKSFFKDNETVNKVHEIKTSESEKRIEFSSRSKSKMNPKNKTKQTKK